MRFDAQFSDPKLEAQFRDDVRERMFWVVVGPWIAGAVIVLLSVAQAYLRLGADDEWFAVTAIRLFLVGSIVAAFLTARRRLYGPAFRWASLVVLVGIVLFDVTAVTSGATDWDRIARATIIELFLIGLTLMTLPREAFVGLVVITAAHVGVGVAGYASGPIDLLNNTLLVTMSALISGLIVWRFSLSERRAFIDRRKLRDARAEADRSNAAKSRFLADMSHEIRTPMTGIIGMLDVLLDADLPDTERGRVQDARDSAGALLAILNDVLDHSKIESEGVTLVPGDFDVTALVEQVGLLFERRARDRDVSLTVDATGVPRFLFADSARLRQVLANLVGNAIKFTHGATVSVSAAWDARGARVGRLRVDVADQGIGISQAGQAGLFQRFNQADETTTERAGGTGLGLSISKDIVEAMGGSIGVTSREGEGSTFWFEVPCREGCAPEPVAAVEARFGERTASVRVLVAEDNPVNQKIIAAFLRKAGHEPVLVDDGRKAVEQARDSSFDVVLMDVQMPVLDGVGALLAIRNLGGIASTVPVIALTAETMDGDRERLLEGGHERLRCQTDRPRPAAR